MNLDRFVIRISRFRAVSLIGVISSAIGAMLMFIIGAVKTVKAWMAFFPGGLNLTSGKTLEANVAIALIAKGSLPGFLQTGCLALFALVAFSGCKEDETASPGSETAGGGSPAFVSPWHEIPGAEYAGAESCRSCHEAEFNDWLQSDHHRAMEPATDETVHGDFNNVTFEHFGHTWRFFRKGEEFWVNAEDENGERKDYRIEYTFGFRPLQQYLIPFPGGRYQALQVCWDSRPAEGGGQRWFHLYPDEEVPPGDLLHWTGIHFNWNYMCADCHSTNLDKDYDVESDSYHTTWSEINVSCEACHGPASRHLEWAEIHAAHVAKIESGAAAPDTEPDYGELAEYLDGKGLVVTLKEPVVAGWGVNMDTGLPFRTSPLNSTVQVQVCARCHAHRQLLEPLFTAGRPFLDTHVPSLLTEQLYENDGQIKEEVYVYGSFLQSKMYHAGVRCTDCHHPHTMKLQLTGNALCTRCHLPQKYDTREHHFHDPAQAGASCIECHMPQKYYMVADLRADHSMRVPRPDLTAKTGARNACNGCHNDQTVDWAVNAFHEWWGKGPRNAHYGEHLAAARGGEPGSLDRLILMANDPEWPELVRATALNDLNRHPLTREQIQASSTRLQDPDALVRREAVTLMENLPPAERLKLVEPLLKDPLVAVRVEAVRVLAAAASLMGPDQRAVFDRVAAEFRTQQEAISDRAAGHMRMALYHLDLGRAGEAEAAYRQAVKIEPDAVPVWVNLGELLYQQNRIEEAETAFRSAVKNASMEENRGIAHDALARFLIRQKRYDEGVAELKEAASRLPENAQVQYFLGVALNSTGKFEDALGYLRKAHELAPNNTEYLAGLATICRDAGRYDDAWEAARKLVALDPGNRQSQQLLEQIRMMRQR